MANNDTLDWVQCNTWTPVNLTANDTDPDGHYPLNVTAIHKSDGPAEVEFYIQNSSTVQIKLRDSSGTDPMFSSEYAQFTYTIADTLGGTASAFLFVNAITCSGGGGGFGT